MAIAMRMRSTFSFIGFCRSDDVILNGKTIDMLIILVLLINQAIRHLLILKLYTNCKATAVA